jgi:membrane protein insertase Oxa1/YidC/SpoIIIJ
MSKEMRWFFRGMSGLTFFVTMNFPSIVVIYFATSNTYSLVQSTGLRIPFVRSAFGIPQKVLPPSNTPGLTTTVAATSLSRMPLLSPVRNLTDRSCWHGMLGSPQLG